MACLTWLFVLCAVLRLTVGYSSGAGSAACTSMTPSHGTNTATDDAPYSFTVTQTDGSVVTEYSAGQILRGMRSKNLYSCLLRISREFHFVFRQQSNPFQLFCANIMQKHSPHEQVSIPRSVCWTLNCFRYECDVWIGFITGLRIHTVDYLRFIQYKHKTFKVVL